MNNNQSAEKLFSEFSAANKDQWKEKVIADLKGADFENKLVWRPLEPFTVDPYYTADDLTGLSYLQNYEHSFKNHSEGLKGSRRWVNREKIPVSDAKLANKKALDILNRGADGLLFDLTGQSDVDLKALLNNILALPCSISFIADRNAARLIKGYFTYESERHIDHNELFGSLNYDPIRMLCLNGKMADDAFPILKEILTITDVAERFSGLSINSSQFQNSGSNITQELAFVLNMAVDYIDKLGELGLEPDKVIRNIEFSMSVGTSYFMEIAKLRALRILFHQLVSQYGNQTYDPGSLQIHSVSSIWSKTAIDPYVNMLRNTTEAMSAIIGGCNALTIAPFNESFDQPNDFSRRISRNVSTMLKEESYLDKVVDPSAGSYYIEYLTDQFVKHSWSLFKEIEAEGGFIHSFKSGNVQSRISEVKNSKDVKTSQRRQIFVGTNQYPNVKEIIDPKNITSNANKAIDTEFKVLVPQRGSRLIEEIRLDTERFMLNSEHKKKPKVFLCLIGDNPPMRTARATFSTGFLGCAGFEIIEGPIEKNDDVAVQKALESNSEMIVLCGSDEDYKASGIQIAEKIKNTHPDSILLIAGYPAEITEPLTSAGVDFFIHLSANLVDTLVKTQKTLHIIK